MKAVVFAGRAALCVAVLAAASAPAALEGWWRFSEPEPDASEDMSGNGRHVFLDTNVVAKSQLGPGGGSAWFDGSADARPHPGEFAYAFAPDFAESSATGAFTVAAWVCPDNPPAYAPIVLCSSDPDGLTDGFGLFVGEGGEAAAFRACGEDEVSEVSGGLLASGMWRHLAARFDGRVLSLWVDGVKLAEAAASPGGCEPAPLALGTIVGRGPAQPFSGGIADVRIWSSALSDAEMSSVYRQFVGDAVDHEGDDGGDGMHNGGEAFYGLDPRSAADAGEDPDGDGVSNLAEFRLGRSPGARTRPARPGLIRSVTATVF